MLVQSDPMLTLLGCDVKCPPYSVLHNLSYSDKNIVVVIKEDIDTNDLASCSGVNVLDNSV